MPTTRRPRHHHNRADAIASAATVLALAVLWAGLIYLWFVPR